MKLLALLLCIFILCNADTSPPDDGEDIPDTISLTATIRDQAPAYMTHSNFPSFWWTYPGKKGWTDNPTSGHSGTANGSYGFSDSDFELPFWMFGTIRSPDPTVNANGETPPKGEQGIVGTVCTKDNLGTCGKLNSSDSFPAPSYAYTGMSKGGSVQSPDTFYTWFHDSDRTVTIPFNFVLTRDGTARTYTYENNNFYPIDGKGWKDEGKSNNGSMHNFAFCSQMHSLFGYEGGETFTFSGDDDVFVYLNGYLVLDIGGIHGTLTQSVSLDDLGFLNKGSTYPFDMFYCERHTVNSDITITTSLQFQCPKDLIDWCNICGGDGTSCCQGDALAACDDHSVCTIDNCGVQANTCVHKNITCTPNNKCDNAACDPVKGCQHTPVSCVPPDQCHTAHCSTSSGCVYPVIPCPQNACYTTPTGGCDPNKGCQYTVKQCPASDACTKWSCDNSTGCVSTPIVTCDDHSVCTTDTCDPATGKCTHQNITATKCNDNKPCTLDLCDPINGCSNPPVTCNGNDCQTASCNVNTGKCDVQNLTCAESTGCTVGTCPPKDKCSTPQKSCTGTNNCTYIEKDCSTGTACLTSGCDLATGECTKPVSVNPDGFCIPCANAKNGVCTWDDPCNPATCNAQGQCVTAPFTCTAPNMCSTSTCKNVNGTATCQVGALTCSSATAADQCTTVSCDPKLGCVNSTSTCEDYNPCTVDTCTGPNNCSNTIPPTVCDDKNVCTVDSCNSAFSSLDQACQHTNISCPAPNKCKVNTNCDPVAGCVFADVMCPPPADVCTVAHCDPVGGCLYVNKTCVVDDPDCFIGSCEPVNGTCVQNKRSHWSTIKSSKSGKTCFLTYNKAAAVAAITAGAAAGIAIGGAAAIGLIGFGGKKGYDMWQAHAQTMNSGVSNNPLYEASENAGTNPLYGTDA